MPPTFYLLINNLFLSRIFLHPLFPEEVRVIRGHRRISLIVELCALQIVNGGGVGLAKIRAVQVDELAVGTPFGGLCPFLPSLFLSTAFNIASLVSLRGLILLGFFGLPYDVQRALLVRYSV
jgi:hypothetical protein